MAETPQQKVAREARERQAEQQQAARDAAAKKQALENLDAKDREADRAQDQ